ncbi:MAG TPA: hypothetical protein VNY05_13615 [Candidatus Acidoferrales bacterium]|jgi:hypothetical protein|nr:hypothetical protein [Candidatus Acidoferrales bacterium]
MEKPIRKLAALLVCAAAAFTLPAQDPRETGPTTLVVTYRCPPEKRSELRNIMRQDGLQRLEGYRRNTILAGYRVLLSRYVDTNNWDMMLLLSFPDYTAVEKWKRIEHESPAGLPPSLLPIATSITTYPLDLMRRKAADDTPLEPVYLVIPYTYSVTAPAYLQYVDDYVTPQFDGWIGEGILTRYEMYMQRYTAARPWDALIVLEYKDEESFGRRETVMAKIRQRLQANPKWKAIAGNKPAIRVEKEAVIADELTLPQ